MTPFGQTLVRTTTIHHHTERGTATTAHNARLRWEEARTVEGLIAAIPAEATTAGRRAGWYARN